MLKGICYNASRQERRKCSLWHAKSPGVATSGAFLFRCGKVAYALGWLPPIYLRPAICRCSRRLHLPRQRVRKTKIYSWWHTPFVLNEDGTSKQADLEGGWYEFEKDYFGSVFFEGKTIPCISLKGQKVFHSGYELRDKDKHDISILESLSK